MALLIIPVMAFVALSHSSYAMETTTGDSMMKKENTMMKKDDSMMSTGVNLSLGSRGADVTMLQTFLESKGLLVIPAGVSKGYFGPLTKSALMAFQTSVDVPSTGYYGPITRGVMAKMMMAKEDTMMKKDDTMMKTEDTTMKKEDTMKKGDAMMDKKAQ